MSNASLVWGVYWQCGDETDWANEITGEPMTLSEEAAKVLAEQWNQEAEKKGLFYKHTARPFIPHGVAVETIDKLEKEVARLTLINRELENDLDKTREGYRTLDVNWATIHQAAMESIRLALGDPDASVPDLLEKIKLLKRKAKGWTAE